MRDVAFKYNIMRHSATQESPCTIWHGRQARMTCIYTFGQIGTAPIHAHETKLQGRSDPARYMYPMSETQIMTITIRNLRYRFIQRSTSNPAPDNRTPLTRQAMRSKRSPHTQKPATESTSSPANTNRPAQLNPQHQPHDTPRQQGRTPTRHHGKPHTITT